MCDRRSFSVNKVLIVKWDSSHANLYSNESFSLGNTHIQTHNEPVWPLTSDPSPLFHPLCLLTKQTHPQTKRVSIACEPLHRSFFREKLKLIWQRDETENPGKGLDWALQSPGPPKPELCRSWRVFWRFLHFCSCFWKFC